MVTRRGSLNGTMTSSRPFRVATTEMASTVTSNSSHAFPPLTAYRREPLKAIMTVISKLAPSTQWKHSWKHLTIQEKDTENYLAWVATDHLHGTAKIYVAKKFFSARQFEDEFQAAYSANMSRKVIGNKGKGKRSEQEGVLTPGDFLRAVGLGSEGKAHI